MLELKISLVKVLEQSRCADSKATKQRWYSNEQLGKAYNVQKDSWVVTSSRFWEIFLDGCKVGMLMLLVKWTEFSFEMESRLLGRKPGMAFCRAEIC